MSMRMSDVKQCQMQMYMDGKDEVSGSWEMQL